MSFINSLKSKWQQTKKTAALWLCLSAGLLLPLVFLYFFLIDHYSINNYNAQTCSYKIGIWQTYFIKIWQNMAFIVFPLFIIVSSTLIPQKVNNILPQSYPHFINKFSVFLCMIIAALVFFNLALILAGIIPSWLFDKHLPNQRFPIIYFLKGNLKFFICCLPLVAMQFILRINFKSFLVPLGVGILCFAASMACLKHKYILISPFISCPLPLKQSKTPFNIYGYAIVYFLILMAMGYWFYVRNNKKMIDK